MIRCLDIHTHHPAPALCAVVAESIQGFEPFPGQYYSVGIHPWETVRNITPEEYRQLEKMAEKEYVVAIGECGIDKLKGGPLFRQMNLFKRHIDLSEELKKPLIIHDVKAHDVIVGLKRDLNPTQKWLVHGFRGKPSVAKMLTDAGIYLSFGEKFNPETLLSVPRNMILAETDESTLPIEEIIGNLSAVIGHDITDLIADNTSFFLFGSNINCGI